MRAEQREQRAEGVGEDHRRPCQAHGQCAAEEQPGTDGPADGDHRAAFSRDELDALLGLATQGLSEIIDLQALLVAEPPAPRVLGR